MQGEVPIWRLDLQVKNVGGQVLSPASTRKKMEKMDKWFDFLIKKEMWFFFC